MPTTTTERRPGAFVPGEDRANREEIAQRLLDALTDVPQSARSLGPRVGLKRGSAAALGVLESRGLAKRVRAGNNTLGWVRGDAAGEAVHERRGGALAAPDAAEYPPPTPMVVSFDDMYVPDYQRALTTFAERIAAHYDPLLMGVFILSDRGAKHEPARYAILDGQTRRIGARRRGVNEWVAIVYTGLTPGQEASLYAKLQRERRGMTSWDSFRASMLGEPDDPDTIEANAIFELARLAGYQLGHETGKLKAVAALRQCYRKDDFLLERTLVILRMAFPTEIPASSHIQGLHYWMRDPKKKFRAKGAERSWDDEKLVRRLRTTGLKRLTYLANAAAEVSGTNSTDKNMAQAIDGAYRSAPGRSRAQAA